MKKYVVSIALLLLFVLAPVPAHACYNNYNYVDLYTSTVYSTSYDASINQYKIDVVIDDNIYSFFADDNYYHINDMLLLYVATSGDNIIITNAYKI